MKTKGLENITPGEILEEEYLKPLGMSQYAIAKALGVPRIRISEIVRGKRKITPDTAIRLGLFFETSPEFWLRMQAECYLDQVRGKLEKKLRPRVKPYSQSGFARKAA